MERADRQGRHELAERVEAWFVLPTTLAALLAIPAVLVPLMWPEPEVKTAGLWLDWLIWGVFALEVIVLEVIEPDHVSWIRHHRLMMFILFAAWPGWMTVFEGTGVGSVVPILLLVQKLLKLLKIDRFFRHKGTHRVTGAWLLLVPGAAAVLVVWLKLGWFGGVILGVGLVLALVAPEGRRHPRVRRALGRDPAPETTPADR